MIGSSMYLTGIEVKMESMYRMPSCCSMCKRMIINAGIDKVYIRDTKDEYRCIEVSEWIKNDESLLGVFGY